MPSASDYKAAVEGKNAALLESALIKRSIYVFAEGEDPTDYTALENGIVPLAISLSDTRTVFWLDPDDTTSSHDGVAVIVTDDGYRYHASDFRWPTSILAVGEETPPGSPSTGDAYHLGAAPTGDWSSNANDIAIYTSRGWIFLEPPVGLLFYNEDDSQHYYMDENGDFVAISVIPGAGTVFHDAIVGGRRFYVVENQTTDTPPTATVGVWHIVGPSPTGAWSGHAGELATSKDGSTFVFVTPTEGDHAYDKALNALYRYDSTWINAAGAFVGQTSAATNASAAITEDGSGAGNAGYQYSDTVAPATTHEHRGVETVSVTHTATASGKIIEIDYAARLTMTRSGAGGWTTTIGLFRDSETTAIDWQRVSDDLEQYVNVKFRIAAGDASSHTYKIRVFGYIDTGSASTTTFTVARRRMFLREAA